MRGKPPQCGLAWDFHGPDAAERANAPEIIPKTKMAAITAAILVCLAAKRELLKPRA